MKQQKQCLTSELEAVAGSPLLSLPCTPNSEWIGLAFLLLIIPVNYIEFSLLSFAFKQDSMMKSIHINDFPGF